MREVDFGNAALARPALDEPDEATTQADPPDAWVDREALQLDDWTGRRTRRGSRVAVAIRPEHTRLEADVGNAHFAATLNHSVYFGTDTHYHLTLDGGAPFTVRIQNASLREATFAAGQRVGVTIAEGCIQVLKD
ncbi:MAG: TOBE domain-containing protein [Allorhizobium sp.]